jgi:hypothetical protein
VCRGIAQNSIYDLMRGPTESNALVGEPALLNSYTTSASKSKKESNTGFREEQLKSLRYFCTLHFPPNYVMTLDELKSLRENDHLENRVP